MTTKTQLWLAIMVIGFLLLIILRQHDPLFRAPGFFAIGGMIFSIIGWWISEKTYPESD